LPPLLGRAALFRALEPGRLALQLAQVEEPRPLHLAAGRDLDLVDPRREERKDTLDAHPVAHLAHGEGGVEMGPPPADHHALEDLDAFLVAFADLRVHLDRVADAKLGDLTPGFRLHVALLHQLDRLRTHLRTLFLRQSVTARLKTTFRQVILSRSGRRSRVRESACSRRHCAIFAWSPESRTSGTLRPRNSGGRVYCGPSSSPSPAKLSLCAERSLPSTPGTSRAAASITASAASSPPVSTKSPTDSSSSIQPSTRSSTPSYRPQTRISSPSRTSACARA